MTTKTSKKLTADQQFDVEFTIRSIKHNLKAYKFSNALIACLLEFYDLESFILTFPEDKNIIWHFRGHADALVHTLQNF